MKKFLSALLAVIVILAAVVLSRTLLLQSKQIPAPGLATIAVDKDAAAGRLATILGFPTISHSSREDFDPRPFIALRRFLETAYPNMHRELEREIVNGYSLLYTWPGSDAALAPVLLMGHMDVVPVEPGTEGRWEHPPFGGVIDGGYVWGRGAMDDKASVTSIFEAVETLLGQGFAPARTVYFAFGHDEEVGGEEGALKVAELLAGRGVHFEFVLDEGMAIRQGILPGFNLPVAAVSVAEKGYVTLELTAHAEGGHSARPPELTAVGALARAIASLEAHRLAPSLDGPTGAMFAYLASEMPFTQRMMVANQWLFGGLLTSSLAASRATNPMVRTTTAATVIHGGIKDNVLPTTATALVNFRVRPGETGREVITHARKVIRDGAVEIDFYQGAVTDPSPVASIDGIGFRAIERAVRTIYPEVLVSPGLTLGATDSRHYIPVSDNVYRFVPIWFTRNDTGRVHGTNERLSVDNLEKIIKFYALVITGAAG